MPGSPAAAGLSWSLPIPMCPGRFVPYEELGAEYTTVDSDEDLGDRGGQDFENQLRREGSEKFC